MDTTMTKDRDIKTICDEISYRVGELAGIIIHYEVEAKNLKAENAELKKKADEYDKWLPYLAIHGMV